ncbi:MAG: cytochrome c oxidase subunit II [Acidobacteriaceae bacterium]
MRRLLLISPLFLTILGCRHAQSTLYGSGPAANRIANLSWLMVILFLAITAIMWGLIALAAILRKGTLEEHAPIDVGGGQGWIAIGGVAIPFVVLCVLFILGLSLLKKFPIHDTAKADLKPQILVVGHQWWWEVHYLNDNPSLQVTTANEIHIPSNQPVTIELESRDVIHSFWVPALHGKVDLIPGHPNFIRIEASHPGSYRGECAVFCGAQHAHMRLLVIAQPPEVFQEWLKEQREPAQAPTTPDAIAGEKVFLNGPCMMCHSIRGTLAGGTVAPDLTHIGSRQMIAANSFPNDDAYLEAWVTHAQSLKPGALMPNLAAFNGRQLRDLVAYLRQLK